MPGRDADTWERNTAGMPLSEMLPVIRKAGFRAIYIDRFGYADNGLHICSHLSELLGETPVQSGDGRLAFFKL